MTLLLAVPVGLLIGLLLGALGGGGSIVAVPALVYLLGQSPHAATTGALVVVGVSAVTAMLAHRRDGRVRIGQGLVFGLLGVAGTYVGTRASASVNPNLLLAGFAGLMAVAAVAMLRRRGARPRGGATDAPPEVETEAVVDSTPIGSGAPGTGARVATATAVPTPTTTALTAAPAPDAAPLAEGGLTPTRAVKVLLTALLVGLLTGFFGVGGGFVVVPALVLALGFDMPTAVGTSLLVITVNAGSALAIRFGSSTGLDWPLLGVFAAAAMLGSLGGQKVTTRVRPRTLSVSFAVLCLLLAVFIAARTVPHLLPL